MAEQSSFFQKNGTILQRCTHFSLFSLKWAVRKLWHSSLPSALLWAFTPIFPFYCSACRSLAETWVNPGLPLSLLRHHANHVRGGNYDGKKIWFGPNLVALRVSLQVIYYAPRTFPLQALPVFSFAISLRAIVYIECVTMCFCSVCMCVTMFPGIYLPW